MTAAKVIEEIQQLAPNDQAEVIQFAVDLARRRQLSARNWANWRIGWRAAPTPRRLFG